MEASLSVQEEEVQPPPNPEETAANGPSHRSVGKLDIGTGKHLISRVNQNNP